MRNILIVALSIVVSSILPGIRANASSAAPCDYANHVYPDSLIEATPGDSLWIPITGCNETDAPQLYVRNVIGDRSWPFRIQDDPLTLFARECLTLVDLVVVPDTAAAGINECRSTFGAFACRVVRINVHTVAAVPQTESIRIADLAVVVHEPTLRFRIWSDTGGSCGVRVLDVHGRRVVDAAIELAGGAGTPVVLVLPESIRSGMMFLAIERGAHRDVRRFAFVE
jgi:hypothetical protein